jgi:transcriptional regulator with AAA-type ATPase domain/tetratricopeptide (TPR) repeat protein
MPATSTPLPSRFELLEDLGQSTFRVKDLESDAVVVLRVMSQKEGPRVRRELSRLLELDDPGLARVLSLGELEDGRPYYVQEFVAGEELFRWALGRDASEVLEVWAQLVRTLASYHGRGLVPRGERRLVARVEEHEGAQRLRLVDPGGVVEEGARPIRGTFAHGLAPERRARTRVDRRASLYEAGLILYELLAGSDSLGAIQLDEAPEARPPVTTLAPGLPLDLATFVMVLLRPYPDERPVSVNDALEALSRVSGQDFSAGLPAPRLPLPTRCFGRGAVLEQLGAWAEPLLTKVSSSGNPSLVLLQGPAGSGRRRLQDELALRLVLEDLRLLRATCGRAGEAPFGSVGAVIANMAGTGAFEEAPSEALWALRALAPHRATELPAGPTPPPVSDPHLRRERLRGAVCELALAAARRQPLVLLLEDLDRARPETLELLGEIAREAAQSDEGVRLLIVATSASSLPVLRGLGCEELALPPLDGEAVQALLTAALGSEPAPELLERAILESDGLPGRVLSLVRRELGPQVELPAQAEAVKQTLAALGREAEVTLIAQAARTSPAQAEQALSALFQVGEVNRLGDYWELSEPAESESPELCARLARFLAARITESSPWSRRLEVAELAARGGEQELLFEHAETGLGLLESLSSEERAAELALACAERCPEGEAFGWRLRAASLFLAAGEAERAEALLRDLIDEPGEQSDEQRAELWISLTQCLSLRDQEREARSALSWAHTYLQDSGLQEGESGQAGEGATLPLLRARVAAQAALLHLDAEEVPEARAKAEAGLELLKAVGRLGPAGHRQRAELLVILGRAAALEEDLVEAGQMLKAALAIQEREGLQEAAAKSLIRLGKVAFAAGRWSQAEAHWQAGRELALRLGDRRGLARLAGSLGLCATRRGRYPQAEALLRESLRAREVLGDLAGAAASLHNLAYVYRCVGAHDKAAAGYRRALDLRIELQDTWYAALGALALGEVLLELGNPDEAQRLLEHALESLKDLGDRRGEAGALAAMAELERRRGRHGVALRHLGEVERIRSEQESEPEEQLATHRLRARVRMGLGQLEQARRLAIAAVKLTEDDDSLANWEASARLLLGQVQARRARGRGSARRELERARRAAERIGDRWTSRAASIELAALRLSSGQPSDARALIDSRPVPRPGRMQPITGSAPDQRGVLRVRERLLRARIELALETGSVATAARCAEQALEEAQRAQLRELEWRSTQALAGSAELRGSHERALQLTLEAQEQVEALVAEVPEAFREDYLGSDVLRQAALGGESPVSALGARAQIMSESSTPIPLVDREGLLSAMVTSTQPTISQPHSTDPLQRLAALELEPEPAEPAPPAAPGGAAFAALVRLNRLIVDEPSLASIYEAIVSEAAQLSGGERGFLVVFGESVDEARVLATNGIDEVERGQRFFRRCAYKAASSGQIVLSAEARVRPELKAEAHLVGLGLRSVIAAPVTVPDGSRGALYIDAAFQVGRFTDREVELLSALADLSALAVGRGILEEALHGRRGLPAPGPEQREYLQAKARRDQAPVSFGSGERRLVGRSQALRVAVEALEQAAPTRASVLIWGPGGVGKGVAARALHDRRVRDGVLPEGAPVVALDLRELRADQIERELFGGPEGPGLLASAHRGTLLLEHLAEAPLQLQRLLVRALEDGSVRPLGGGEEEQLELTLVATLGEDPGDCVVAGRLDPDLCLLLGQLRVSIPALDTRPEDKVPLADALLAAWPLRPNQTPPLLTPGARQAIEARSYPGNARELNAVLASGMVLADGRAIDVDDLPYERPSELKPLRMALADYERRYVEEALLANRSDLTATAATLGITRRSLLRKLKQLQITP